LRSRQSGSIVELLRFVIPAPEPESSHKIARTARTSSPGSRGQAAG